MKYIFQFILCSKNLLHFYFIYTSVIFYSVHSKLLTGNLNELCKLKLKEWLQKKEINRVLFQKWFWPNTFITSNLLIIICITLHCVTQEINLTCWRTRPFLSLSFSYNNSISCQTFLLPVWLIASFVSTWWRQVPV